MEALNHRMVSEAPETKLTSEDTLKHASCFSACRQIGKQGGLGFRSEVLIEDTHTSIDLFRQGWKSVYVNFPKVLHLL